MKTQHHKVPVWNLQSALFIESVGHIEERVEGIRSEISRVFRGVYSVQFELSAACATWGAPTRCDSDVGGSAPRCGHRDQARSVETEKQLVWVGGVQINRVSTAKQQENVRTEWLSCGATC